MAGSLVDVPHPAARLSFALVCPKDRAVTGSSGVLLAAPPARCPRQGRGEDQPNDDSD
jgi:hypothetical protein